MLSRMIVLYVFTFIGYFISSVPCFSQIYDLEADDEYGKSNEKQVIMDEQYVNRDTLNKTNMQSRLIIHPFLSRDRKTHASDEKKYALTGISVVTTTSDLGQGSLRNAIINANNNIGPDSIVFNIPQSDPGFNAATNTWTIQPLSELPHFMDNGTILDASTQPGYTGQPVVEINGSQIDTANGFTVNSSFNEIKGFIINGFRGKEAVYENSSSANGIIVTGDQNSISGNFIGTDVTGSLTMGNEWNGILIRSSSNVIENNLISGNSGNGIEISTRGDINNLILGNKIGTDITGTFAIENKDHGIFTKGNNTIIGDSISSYGNTISGNGHYGVFVESYSNQLIGNYIGTDISGSIKVPNGSSGIRIDNYYDYNLIQRNLISGNDYCGIHIGAVWYATGIALDNVIIGNLIGTDITGTMKLGNDSYGIQLEFNTKYNIIGGDSEEERNIISGNWYGILIDAGRNNIISGNYVGTDITGENDIGNEYYGIEIDYDPVSGMSNEACDNQIGGSTLEEGNLIRYNKGHAIYIRGNEERTGAIRNLISHNAISQNDGKGIRNWYGGNLELQPPIIIGPDTTTGFMPTISGSSLPEVTIELYIDPNSPHDEGYIFLGSTISDLNGNWQIQTGLPLEKGDNYITATAIDADNNTSEFSQPFNVFTPAPDISVADTTLEFGDVIVDLKSSRNITIKNEGIEDLLISSITLIGTHPNQFKIENGEAPFTVSSREQYEVEITFNPTSVGIKNAIVQLESNDPDEAMLQVHLTGTGITVPDIVVKPSSYDLNGVIIGDSGKVDITVLNVGNDTLAIRNISASDPHQFMVTPTSLNISPADSEKVTVIFKPKYKGLQETILSIESNDPDEPTAVVTLTGTGIAQPDIVVSPSFYNFGRIVLGDSSSVNLTMSNPGSDTLIIMNFLFSDSTQFTISRATNTVKPDDFEIVRVVFKPKSGGLHNAVLTIESNDPDQPKFDVYLEGTGVTEPEIVVKPSVHNFGNVVLGDSAKVSLIIYNPGTDTLAISNISSDDVDQFFVSHTTFVITPADSHIVTIIFKPKSEGFHEAVLIIESNDSNQPKVNIVLTGSGLVLKSPLYLISEQTPDNAVRLRWQIPNMGKTKNSGSKAHSDITLKTAILNSFNIYRKLESPVEAIEQNRIGSVNADKTTFADNNIQIDKNYYYVVTAVYDLGESGPSNETSILVTEISNLGDESIPKSFSLMQNYPNPFNPETTIGYQLPKTTHVKLQIYNLKGQKVLTLIDKTQPAGIYFVTWSGKDRLLRDVASGVYCYKLQTKEFVKVKKLMLVR